ncbi:MAG: efflux transporter, family, subunit [Pedosphaera sp.]|nr:efflux transporter, family, subunit [Pedosphaera sp.]
MKIRNTIRLISLLVPLLALPACSPKKQAASPPPPEVEVVAVQPTDVPLYQEWIGTLDGFVNAQIRAQVTGYLMTQDYKEGAQAKKGDLLFQIDPRPFQAALDQANGQLAQAEAQLDKAELDVERYTPLAKQKAISQEELVDAEHSGMVAKATVASAKATVETAALNLEFTKIASPIDGIAGMARAQIGDLVGPASGELTTVSTFDPIKVYFTVTESYYMDYMNRYADEAKRAEYDRGLELELVMGDGTVYPHKGKFYFADRQVDVRTGALRVAGLIPNPGRVLRPGQFARVRAITRTRNGVLSVPQRAVMELQGNYQLAVVDAENKVSIRPVKVGDRFGNMWIIEDGLKAGEQVIVEGTQKARQGTVVAPKPYAPAAALAKKD